MRGKSVCLKTHCWFGLLLLVVLWFSCTLPQEIAHVKFKLYIILCLLTEPTPATEHDIEVNPVSKGIADLGDEVVNPSEDSDFSEVENGNDVDPPVQVTPGDAQEASQAAATVSQENVPKKSYASIVSCYSCHFPFIYVT